MERDEADLIDAARAGDRVAVERLLRAHVDRVHALCHRLVGPTDAEDAAQDALVAIVRGLPRFDGRCAFSTWIHRVTTNCCLDELRRRRRRPQVVRSVDPGASSDPTQHGLDLADRAPLADDVVPERLGIDAALAQLPAEFRAPVVLRDQLGLDYAEIGEVLGLAPGTVRSRIARGRARLADALDPGQGNPSPSDDVERSRP